MSGFVVRAVLTVTLMTALSGTADAAGDPAAGKSVFQ